MKIKTKVRLGLAAIILIIAINIVSFVIEVSSHNYIWAFIYSISGTIATLAFALYVLYQLIKIYNNDRKIYNDKRNKDTRV